MSKCNICGEYVDWDNPNIHYGGHVCRKSDIENYNKQKESESQNIETSIKQIAEHSSKENYGYSFHNNFKKPNSWKEVFNGDKFCGDYYELLNFVDKYTYYRYFTFNTIVFSVDDKNKQYPICWDSGIY